MDKPKPQRPRPTQITIVLKEQARKNLDDIIAYHQSRGLPMYNKTDAVHDAITKLWNRIRYE